MVIVGLLVRVEVDVDIMEVSLLITIVKGNQWDARLIAGEDFQEEESGLMVDG